MESQTLFYLPVLTQPPGAGHPARCPQQAMSWPSRSSHLGKAPSWTDPEQKPLRAVGQGTLACQGFQERTLQAEGTAGAKAWGLQVQDMEVSVVFGQFARCGLWGASESRTHLAGQMGVGIPRCRRASLLSPPSSQPLSSPRHSAPFILWPQDSGAPPRPIQDSCHTCN